MLRSKLLRSKSAALCLLCGVALLDVARAGAQTNVMEVSSPDHRITMRFAVKPAKDATAPDGQLVYSIEFEGKQVFEDSALSLQLANQELANQPPLGSAVHITGTTAGSGVDDYTLVAGKTSAVHDAYNSLTVHVAEAAPPGRNFDIEARAYSSGVAFRYHVPEQAALQRYLLTQEDTEFRPVMDADSWQLRLPNSQSAYESEYVPATLSALANQGGVASNILNGAPMLMHMPGVAWAAVGEADLEGNAAMYLQNPTGSWTGHYLVTRISPALDAKFDAKDAKPDSKLPAVDAPLPHDSAWRVILLADRPTRFIESNLFTDLNPPNRIADTSWIHPGKASWDWWSGDLGPDGQSAYTTANMEYYVDFAAASGFPYFMLDAGWSGFDILKMRGNVDVPALVEYAAKKNVKVWIWLYSKSVAAQMERAFPLYEKWGVAGVKIDFVLRNDQEGIRWYYAVAKLAAEHHLMVDFHGATQPWGIQRTYPNVLDYEGVLGLEQNKAGRRDGPVNRTTFPFTRMLSGPMDYTPGAFDNVDPGAVCRAGKESNGDGNTRAATGALRRLRCAASRWYRTRRRLMRTSPHSSSSAMCPPRGMRHAPSMESRENSQPSRGATARSGIWAALPTGRRAIFTCRSSFWALADSQRRFTKMRPMPVRIRSMLRSGSRR